MSMRYDDACNQLKCSKFLKKIPVFASQYYKQQLNKYEKSIFKCVVNCYVTKVISSNLVKILVRLQPFNKVVSPLMKGVTTCSLVAVYSAFELC